ncbi:MAG: YbaK/EbsC family protein [Clostridia bacterium]|nr:YbaK/EbsC family protein [Clostridia bacterium]
MSIQSVKREIEEKNIDLKVIEFEQSTATVDLAAQALGVEPGMIAKTMAFALKDENILVITKGDARINNRKYKDTFKTKAKMLSPDQVKEVTGHPVGGVCPFGLKQPLKIYLDVSLKQYDYVFPAAGSPNSAVRVDVDKLAEITDAVWIDVCK